MRDSESIGAIVDAATRKAPVAWGLDGGLMLLFGAARAITREDGRPLDSDEDVRDGYLYLTSTFDHFV